MKKVCLFIFGLLVLVTVGCATSQKANYGMNMPAKTLDAVMSLVAFIDVGAKRGMIDYNDPSILELQQSVQTYTHYTSWNRDIAEAKVQGYTAIYTNMTDRQFIAEVQQFNEELPQLKQLLAQYAQTVIQRSQAITQNRNAQANQSNQAGS